MCWTTQRIVTSCFSHECKKLVINGTNYKVGNMIETYLKEHGTCNDKFKINKHV